MHNHDEIWAEQAKREQEYQDEHAKKFYKVARLHAAIHGHHNAERFAYSYDTYRKLSRIGVFYLGLLVGIGVCALIRYLI